MAECIHGMVPEWCANCSNLKTPEEEEEVELDFFIKKLMEKR